MVLGVEAGLVQRLHQPQTQVVVADALSGRHSHQCDAVLAAQGVFQQIALFLRLERLTVFLEMANELAVLEPVGLKGDFQLVVEAV